MVGRQDLPKVLGGDNCQASDKESAPQVSKETEETYMDGGGARECHWGGLARKCRK